MGGGSRFEALNAENMEINYGEHADGINPGKSYVSPKQGERLHVSKGKSKANIGSDILNVGRNSVGQLNKLDKSSGIQLAKKKGIEEGTSKGTLSRGSKIQQTRMQVDSCMLNAQSLFKGAGASSNSSVDAEPIIKNDPNPPTFSLGASNPLDPGAIEGETINT